MSTPTEPGPPTDGESPRAHEAPGAAARPTPAGATEPNADDGGADEPTPDEHHAPFADEDLDELEHLSEQQGLAGVRVAAELLEDEFTGKSRVRRLIEIAVALVITAIIFVRVIPKFLDVEYSDVWPLLADVNRWFLTVIVVFWVLTMWCYAGVLHHSLPGLRQVQGLVMNFSGSALANVLPFGGAAGVGATYAQGLSWGFAAGPITLSILITGVWNVFAKLGIPIVVVGMLAVSGDTTRGFAGPALVALAVLAGAVVGFGLIIRSESVARTSGRIADDVAAAGGRLFRRPLAPDTDGPGPVTTRILEFRHRTVGLLRRHWAGLTVWMVLYKAGQGVLQLLCARAVGIEVGWVEIFAVYSLGELLTTVPLTPSGVGLVEAGSAGLLKAFGAPADAAVAAVLLYRAFTYLFEIPLGAVGWGVWATARNWRRPPGTVDALAT